MIPKISPHQLSQVIEKGEPKTMPSARGNDIKSFQYFIKALRNAEIFLSTLMIRKFTPHQVVRSAFVAGEKKMSPNYDWMTIGREKFVYRGNMTVETMHCTVNSR
jgi:hypothetical protein